MAARLLPPLQAMPMNGIWDSDSPYNADKALLFLIKRLLKASFSAVQSVFDVETYQEPAEESGAITSQSSSKGLHMGCADGIKRGIVTDDKKPKKSSCLKSFMKVPVFKGHSVKYPFVVRNEAVGRVSRTMNSLKKFY